MTTQNQLPPISEEQQTVIDLLREHNVIVDSVAGSGKTTCCLFIGKAFYNLKILVLTYNAKLRLETVRKKNKYEVNNIDIHTYHSFCKNFYNDDCITDLKIEEFLFEGNIRPKTNFDYDIIIFDETQDVTPLLFRLAWKIYQDNKKLIAKLCIFGDKNQSVYDFKKADERFITHADQLYNFNSIEFKRCKLSVSFRLTREIALFINNCMLKENRIISNKISGVKPQYIICSTFSHTPFHKIKYIIEILKIEPKDIFILAPSVRNESTPVRRLENYIKMYMKNIPIFVPLDDESELDQEIIDGKLVFSTFHQAKGLERKVTLCFNTDFSYFEYYKKDRNPYVCPNEFYVSTSRSLELLYLFHDYEKDYLPFLDINKLETYCDVEVVRDMNIKELTVTNKPRKIGVTDLLRHIPEKTIDNCVKLLKISTINPVSAKINFETKLVRNKTCETVNDLTGIAIPNYFEYTLKGYMTIFEYLQEKNFEDGVKDIKKKYNLNKINLENLTVEELLYIANCYSADSSGFIFRVDQIHQYNWINKAKLQKCMKRMNSLNISNKAIFEKRILVENMRELFNIKLSGSIDCVDKDNVFEFKCTEKLDNNHKLQLAIYMYMYKMKTGRDEMNYYLYNILFVLLYVSQYYFLYILFFVLVFFLYFFRNICYLFL